MKTGSKPVRANLCFMTVSGKIKSQILVRKMSEVETILKDKTIKKTNGSMIKLFTSIDGFLFGRQTFVKLVLRNAKFIQKMNTSQIDMEIILRTIDHLTLIIAEIIAIK